MTDRIETMDRLAEALDEAVSLVRVLGEHQRADNPVAPELVIPSFDLAARRIEDARQLARELFDA